MQYPNFKTFSKINFLPEPDQELLVRENIKRTEIFSYFTKKFLEGLGKHASLKSRKVRRN